MTPRTRAPGDGSAVQSLLQDLRVFHALDLPQAGAKVLYVNAVHGSELTEPQLPKPGPGQPAALASGNPVGFVIMINNGPTIYDTGDTDVFGDMALISKFYKPDLALVCIVGEGLGYSKGIASRVFNAVAWATCVVMVV